MKNQNMAFDDTHQITTEINQSQNDPRYQHINTPIYLKDGIQRYKIFIEKQRQDIEQLNSLKLHLESTGKICPKAWHWGRFYKAFHPMQEAFWLTTWWETTDNEKQHRFHEQLDYLAKQTTRFRDACASLMEIEDRNWYFKTTDKKYHYE